MLQAWKPEKAYRKAPRTAARSVFVCVLIQAQAAADAVPYLRAIKNGIIKGSQLSGKGIVSQKKGLPHR